MKKPMTSEGSLSDEAIVDMLLHRRCADEQSMALDFARQSKVVSQNFLYH